MRGLLGRFNCWSRLPGKDSDLSEEWGLKHLRLSDREFRYRVVKSEQPSCQESPQRTG